MLRGLADEHVSFAITQALRSRGMDVVSVISLYRAGIDDAILLANATLEERVILTCDTDFHRLAREHWKAEIPFAPIFFWPQQQRSVGEIIRQVLQLSTTLIFSEAKSQVFYL